MPIAILRSRLSRCGGVVAATIRSVGNSVFDRHIWIVGVLLALLSLLYTGTIMITSRRAVVEDARGNVRDLGVILAEQTTRRVETIDLMLQDMQAHIQELGIRTPGEFERLLVGEDTRRFLVARTANPLQDNDINLFDSAGTPVNTSQPSLPRFSIADREYFRQLRDHGESGAVVSEVLTRHSTGAKAFAIARRISGADGTFLGVAATTVDADGLRNFYKAIDTERHLAVTLRRRDGLVLVHYPATGDTNQVMPAAAPWFALVLAGGGTYRDSNDRAAAASIISVNLTHHYPLVLDVAVAEEDILKQWHNHSLYIVVIGGGCSLSLLFIFGLIGWQVRRQKEQNATLSRAMATLQESEARFRDFSDLASDWFWEQDAELRFIAMGLGNPLWAEDKATAIGKLRWELNDTSRDPEHWENHKRAVLAHQPFHDFRFDRTGKNGQMYHLSIAGVPVHDQAGMFTGYRGIGHDITAQIETEQNLRQAKENAERTKALLQDAIDSIVAGFVICDADGRQLVCNEGYRRLYQYQTGSPWVPGNTAEDILRQGLANGKYPAAVGHDQAWLDEWLQRNLEVPSSLELLLADGRWLLMTKQRIRNGGIAILLVDITPLKQAQAALRASEASLERAQEIAQIGSWEMDVATGEVVWSRQLYRMRGLPLAFKPTHDNLTYRHNAADVRPLSDWLADLRAGRQRDPIEIRIMRPDGEERVNLSEGRAEVDPDGVIRRVVGTSQDVTERRLVERALAQSQKMDAIGQLTGGMAHDFNNMLGIVIGNLDLLKPLLGAGALTSELCEEARDGAVRCADLIRRLLAFARRQSLRPDRLDVNVLVSDVSRLLGRTLGEQIVLTLDLDATLWPVKVDATQLEAALINLATNARDAMPKGGQLIIATRNATLDAVYAAQHLEVSAGDYALIEVNDTGTGISPEDIGRIFVPFFTTKASGQGTGLGLSMAFGFVKQSGGHLTVYSEPGLGSTFRVYLPRSTSDGTTTASVPTAEVVVGGDETVLVVEDNAQLRRTAERQLTELGYTVREADCALPALTMLAGEDAVDLLFTDIVMPGTMDGLDLAYRATLLRQGLKVLLTSGFPGGQSAAQRMADSPFRLLDKPYSLGDLAQAVRMVLDSAGNGGDFTPPGPVAEPAGAAPDG